MIGADVRRVDGGDAVLQDANAIFTQPADNGPARTGPEVGGADAGFAVQRFADGRLQPQLELFAGEDGDRLRLLKQIAAERRGADDDAFVGRFLGRGGGRRTDGVLGDAGRCADNQRERKQDGWFDVDSPKD